MAAQETDMSIIVRSDVATPDALRTAITRGCSVLHFTG